MVTKVHSSLTTYTLLAGAAGQLNLFGSGALILVLFIGVFWNFFWFLDFFDLFPISVSWRGKSEIVHHVVVIGLEFGLVVIVSVLGFIAIIVSVGIVAFR